MTVLLEYIDTELSACSIYSQKNFMRIIGNDQKNNGQNFGKIIGKISSLIGAGLIYT